MRFNAFVSVAALAKLCASTPVDGVMLQAQRAQVATTARNVDLALMANNECKAQSCVLADASGSSGRQPQFMPEGANDEDKKCIVKYNPSVEPLLKQKDIPNVPKQDTGKSTDLFKYLDGLQRPNERKNGETDKGTFTGKCAPNILVFSKGTLEPTQ